MSIYTSNKHIMPQIDFSSKIQKWSLDIRLHDISPLRAIMVELFFLKHCFYVLKSQTHFDSTATITVLTGFYDPSVVLFDSFLSFAYFSVSAMIVL